jgi:hypothetical protein
MFIRAKKIKNKEYAYLVENIWTKKGSRQKVKKYLGKITKTTRILENEYKIDESKKYTDIIKELIETELKNHNITENKNKIISLNEGFLCEETIKKLQELKPEKESRPDKEGERLAIALLEAGLSIKKEEFSKLFQLWKMHNT